MMAAGPEARPGTAASAARSFDGVVFLAGGDWWYHNRGHYCMQMARHLHERVPVLYVNSMGVRVPRPSEGRMFVRRVSRKLASWARGFRLAEPGLGVLSCVALPGARGARWSRDVATAQIARALRQLGIERPLAWVVAPPAAEVLVRLPHAGLVYQRTDRWEEFPGADKSAIRAYDRRLKDEADLTLYCSRHLYDEERPACPSARFLDHGVDAAAFEAAGRGAQPEPEDVRGIPHPRVGFVGGIDSHTFDAEMFVQVARLLPDLQFVLVGACSLPDGWCSEPNVHRLGQRPYEQVAGYMAACDVLIMPWNRNEWIRACNPVKLKEYLAVGRPVVSTPFPELRSYEGLVAVADTPEAFAAAIHRALSSPPEPEALRARVRTETWSARAASLLDLLLERGLHPIARLAA